jgi:uncharacterized protein YmfQ (DUF2313 family)
MLAAWCVELQRIQIEIENLIEEADPRTTKNLLLDYERLFGLPTECTANEERTIDERRNALHAQMISQGGQSRAYYITVAKAAGYDITITEFRVATVLSSVSSPLYGELWPHTWQVNANGQTVIKDRVFSVNSEVTEPLKQTTTNNVLLECLINRLKPAHTTVIFNYQG